MQQIDLWLSLLFTVTMAALIAPGIIAANHGKLLRNGALWLGIFLALALIYRHFGPFDTASRQMTAPAQTENEKTEAEKPETRDVQDHIEIK